MHVKGYAAPETKAAAERARLLIEQAEALGEHLAGPPIGIFGALRLLGCQQRGIQWRQGSRACGTVPRARRQANDDSSTFDRASHHGSFPNADQAFALYDPVEHLQLATRLAKMPGFRVQAQREAFMELNFCVACGQHQHLRHCLLRPPSQGGKREPRNIITLCRDCTKRARHWDYAHGALIRAGQQAAKASGTLFGRPRKLAAHEIVKAIERRNAGEGLAVIAAAANGSMLLKSHPP
jgi:hypothetical protein